ncbi:iron-siderophore ABC transporter substrate-binding protein [Nocardioides psychrotolerans]|uniref:Iron complex transport system substrate-binding protein n=1 Tax=Nocardioides psychrotolerans TaxID=1005945 RepID=A0A1I3CQY0_9ACTN|nr:iron-siderophore ABC transporter substrate-binding protein [Nocardioides psychrotolerans]SFH76649.1 iron complex transport system substrate-binding protein [Nocardioides psychrotolerans]
MPPTRSSTVDRSTPRRARLALALGAALLAVPLAACGADPEAEPDGSAGGGETASEAFEAVTIEHAFGSTEIDEEPLRVVTWGWGSSDAAIALGVVPVAIPKNSYGADEEGYMPWQQEAIDASGAEEPTLLTEAAEPPLEEIIAAEPDLILANYSGITEADYEKLSQIADTVAYPDEPWSTPWREVITTVGDALGKADEAAQLLEDVDAEVAAAAAAHPEFEGRTIAAVAIDPNAFYVYTPADPRVQFLEDLGFTVADSVDELDTGESTFYYTLSTEEVDKLTSDVLLSYVADQTVRDDIAADPALQAMQQVQDGTVASVVGESYISSVSPPTALSLTWGLETFVESLVPAVEAAG